MQITELVAKAQNAVPAKWTNDSRQCARSTSIDLDAHRMVIEVDIHEARLILDVPARKSLPEGVRLGGRFLLPPLRDKVNDEPWRPSSVIVRISGNAFLKRPIGRVPDASPINFILPILRVITQKPGIRSKIPLERLIPALTAAAGKRDDISVTCDVECINSSEIMAPRGLINLPLPMNDAPKAMRKLLSLAKPQGFLIGRFDRGQERVMAIRPALIIAPNMGSLSGHERILATREMNALLETRDGEAE
jgi:hypothetical protein